MKLTGSRLLLGGAALLATSLSVLWWSGRSGEEPAAVAPLSHASLYWREGTAQQYDVRVDSSMVMKMPEASQGMRVGISGVLDVQTLDSGPDSARVGMRFAMIDMRVAGNSDVETNRALMAPFRVRFALTGMPERFEFPANVSAEHRAILENLVRMFQVTMKGGEAWTARESNASGAYEAAYRRTTATSVQKTKRGVVGNPSTPVYSGANIDSTETLRVEPQHDWLAAMSIEEKVQTRGRGRPPMEITTRATLALRPSARAASVADAWRFAAAAPPAPDADSAQAAPTFSPEQAHRQILDAVATLDEVSEGRTVLIHRLRDLLRVHGSLPAALLEVLQTEELTDRTRADLYLAFELAGTEEAQAALSSVVGNPGWSLRDSMRAIVALGGVSRPTASTLAALWVTAQGAPSTHDGRQLASTATFALGSLGDTLNKANDPSYSSLRSQLLSGALGGSSTEQRTNFVHAIGNTRDASLTSDVAALLNDPATDVRRAAALSLGMLDVDRAAAQLLARFDRERSSEVRGAIAESLVNWTAPTAAAMTTMRNGVTGERDENTRYYTARLLSANLERFPANRPVLQQLLRIEQSKRIRQVVAEALAASR